MKNEELIKLKERVQQLKQERDLVLSIQSEINELEKTEEVKKYLELLNLYEEKTTGKNTGIVDYTDRKIIRTALENTDITPDEDIYVYMGTYKDSGEFGIFYGSRDRLVNREDHDADYVLYQNLEAHHWENVQIPYANADEFEATHKIIIPQNIANWRSFFYDLQEEYFETMIFESQKKAKEKVNELIRK